MEKIIFSGDYIRATGFEVEGATRLMVLFDHLRPEPGFPVVAPAEFVRSRGISQVRVTLSNMDYFLNPDLREARRALKRYARGYATVTGFGFSLGGFGALLFAKAMDISRVVLVSPASPRFPEPLDLTKVNLVDEAEIFRHHPGDLGGLPSALQGFILFDPWFNSGGDRSYARVLSTLVPGLTPVAMPGAGHPASALVTGLGEYYRLAQAAVAAGANAATFRDLHRQTRMRDKEYMARITDRLAVCER